MRQIGPCLALSCLGLILWSLALASPLAAIHLAVGRSASVDVPSALSRLAMADEWELFCAIALTLLIVPAVRLLAVLAVPLSSIFGKVPRLVKWTFLFVTHSRNWAMVDVFLLGAMIALLRLDDWGSVEFGLSFVAFAGLALCSTTLDALLHPGAYLARWERSDPTLDAPPQDAPSLHAPSLHATARPPRERMACDHCDALVLSTADERCPRCERSLRHRAPHSLQHSWALVLAAAFLIVPANVWPMVTMHHMQDRGPKTIYGGVVELYRSDNVGLAVVVFAASIVVPVLKLALLAALLLLTQLRSARALQLRARAHRFVVLIGRWSMIDIFATLMLFTLARFGWFGSVQPESGAVAFCAVVFLTMWAAESFDSRLMWDRAKSGKARSA